MAQSPDGALAGMTQEQVEWTQAVVDNVGRELVYTHGVYVLPAMTFGEFALAEQFALDHDADLRTLSPEGVRIGIVDPSAHPRVLFRPQAEPAVIPEGDDPRFAAWPTPQDPTTLHYLVRTQDGLDQTTGAGDRSALIALREKIIRFGCANGLASATAQATQPTAPQTANAK